MQVRYLVSFSGFFLGEETTQKPKKESIQKERQTATEATNKRGEEEQAWEGRRPGWGLVVVVVVVVVIGREKWTHSEDAPRAGARAVGTFGPARAD
jgi:hypothetical protein